MITSFVSNRGGIGKSSLVSQLAPAVARAAPDRVVLVLDLSIQGDASVFLLGGVREPAAAESAARTRGGEALAALGSDKGATAFLAAVTAVPAPARPASTSFWRGVYNNTPAPPSTPPPDWKAFAVRPLDANPDGECPPNLYLIPGGKTLYGVPFEGTALALRAALAASGALVLVDTDAELSERGASLAGLAAADNLALVLSTSWCDYVRALDDPANSLLAALGFLKRTHPELKPAIAHVIFNNVQKRLSMPGGIAAVPGLLSFTPPSTSLEALVEIASHLRSVALDPSGGGRAAFFANQAALASQNDFLRAYVVAVPTVPESAWQWSSRNGAPLACRGVDAAEATQQAAAHIRAAAARFV